MKTHSTTHNIDKKIALKDAFTKENILRVLHESMADQKKVFTGK